MPFSVKLRKIGNSLGLTLPKEVADQMHVAEGDTFHLAAAYGFTLAPAHCFPDGNKRVALTVVDIFLRMNGLALNVDEMNSVLTIQALAAGELTEDALANWITANSVAVR